MLKGLIPMLLLFLFITTLSGQIPPGYYNPANGKTGVALQTALHNIIKGHNSVAYNTLYFHFQSSDAKPGNVVWDMYSDIPGGTPSYVYHYSSGEECGNYGGEGDCYNREHSWPNSWFGGEVYPMYSDMFHLYPTDGYVNNRRSNYAYAEVSTASWTSSNGSKVGSCATPGYSGTVFEPIDEYKGDFARSYFYMSTRYFTEDSGWPGSAQTTGSQLKPWALAMMLQWSSADPVSQKETDRNNAIYGIQNNRNPFIDHPEYANLIWGYPVGVEVSADAERFLKIYPNPAGDDCCLTLPSGFQASALNLNILTVTGIALKADFSITPDRITLNLHDVPAGIYLVVLSDDGKSPPLYGKLIRK
jgi:endonuclease I